MRSSPSRFLPLLLLGLLVALIAPLVSMPPGSAEAGTATDVPTRGYLDLSTVTTDSTLVLQSTASQASVKVNTGAVTISFDNSESADYNPTPIAAGEGHTWTNRSFRRITVTITSTATGKLSWW